MVAASGSGGAANAQASGIERDRARQDPADPVEAEVDEEIAGTLREYLPDETVRLIAPRLRQLVWSVEHPREQTDVEAVGQAAQLFEAVAPGRGQALTDAFLADYRSQTRRQEREQTAQHVVLYAGLAIAAVMSLCLIGGAIYAIRLGYVSGAAVFLGTAAISMIAGFVDASTRRRKADRS